MDINSFLRRKGKKWIILYSIFCVNFAIFLTYVLLLEPYWGDINFTVSGWVDFKINIVLIIGTIIIIPLIYGLSLLTIKLRKLIKNNRMDLSKVMIPTGNSEWIEMINNSAPEIQLGWPGSPSAQEFQASTINYTYINTGDGYSNEEYRVLQTINVDTMVWTIESVERFYQLWCLGVDWVKTNSPYKFNDLESNFLFFPIFPYITIWIALCIVALSSIDIIRHKLIKKQINMLNNKD